MPLGDCAGCEGVVRKMREVTSLLQRHKRANRKEGVVETTFPHDALSAKARVDMPVSKEQ
jgi:hypothetical protein